MAKSKFDPKAFQNRHQQMRMNAGDWLLKNKNALKICQSALIEKYFAALEQDDASPDLYCFLQEIDDAVDLLGQVIADLRNAQFWPEEQKSEAA